MRATIIVVLMCASFALGYKWPRTQWEFDSTTMRLCANNQGSKSCVFVEPKSPWIPVLEKP